MHPSRQAAMCNNLKAAGCSCFLGILPKVNDGIKAQTIVISQLPRSIMVHLYIHDKFHTKGDHHMVYRRIVLNPSRCASSPSKYPWNTCECLHACKFSKKSYSSPTFFEAPISSSTSGAASADSMKTPIFSMDSMAAVCRQKFIPNNVCGTYLIYASNVFKCDLAP